MSPAVVTLGVRYMTPVISVCIVARGFSSHPCSALAPGADTLYCQVGRRIPLRQLTLYFPPLTKIHQFSKRLQGIDLANNKD